MKVDGYLIVVHDEDVTDNFKDPMPVIEAVAKASLPELLRVAQSAVVEVE